MTQDAQIENQALVGKIVAKQIILLDAMNGENKYLNIQSTR